MFCVVATAGVTSSQVSESFLSLQLFCDYIQERKHLKIVAVIMTVITVLTILITIVLIKRLVVAIAVIKVSR